MPSRIRVSNHPSIFPDMSPIVWLLPDQLVQKPANVNKGITISFQNVRIVLYLSVNMTIRIFEEIDLTVSIVDHGKQSDVVTEAHFDALALLIPTREVRYSPTTS